MASALGADADIVEPVSTAYQERQMDLGSRLDKAGSAVRRCGKIDHAAVLDSCWGPSYGPARHGMRRGIRASAPGDDAEPSSGIACRSNCSRDPGRHEET